jgi:hypothetical protein
MKVPISIIEDALRAEDVEGLLELGAPKDEYSHEARRISLELDSSVPGRGSEEQILVIIANVWGNSFDLSEEDLDKRHTALRRVAGRILACCPDLNGLETPPPGES